MGSGNSPHINQTLPIGNGTFPGPGFESQFIDQCLILQLTGHLDLLTICRAHQFVQKYAFLFMVPIGLLGNSLSLLVMLQKQNRSIPSNLYITLLAIVDNIALLSRLTTSMIALHFGNWAYNACKIAFFFTEASLMASAFLITSLTFDRYINVAHPFKVNSLCSWRNTILRSVLVVVLAVLLKMHNIFYSHILPFTKTCIPILPDTPAGKLNLASTIILNFAIPMVIIFTLNIKIGMKLRNNRMKLIKQQTNDIPTQATSGKKRQSQLTIMLLTISCVFLILNLPLYVSASIFELFTSPESEFKYHFATELLVYVALTNNALNFVFYMIVGPKFRSDLRNMFRCKICAKRTNPETTKVTTLSNGN